MLPDGWKSVRFRDIITFSQYGVSRAASNEGNTPILGMSNIVGGKIVAADLDSVLLSNAERSAYLLSKGDILFNRTNSYELVGKTALFDYDAPMVCASYIVRFQVDTRRALPEFICYFFNAVDSQRKLKSLATRGVSQCNINPTTLGRYFSIPLPTIGEQVAISGVLLTWDRAIEQTQKLIDAKLRLKRGLMQQLLTGERRFKEYVKNSSVRRHKYGTTPTDWTPVHMGDIASEVSVRNTGGTTAVVLSCTKHDGLVPSLEYFGGRQIFSKNLSAYKVIKRGQFAYATNHIEEGSIGLLDFEDVGLISPMYTAFQVSEQVSTPFIQKLLKTELYKHIFASFTSASVNRRGSLRWSRFKQIPIYLPPRPEQDRIAACIQLCEDEIQLLRDQVKNLSQQKRGLLQVLLTGKVRVKTPSAPAAVDHLPDVRKMVSVGANSRRKAKK